MVKKNNFFHMGPRSGDDLSDLCIENTPQRPKTITLQLKALNHENKSRLQPALSSHPSTSHASRASREKLYKSATQLSMPRPLFHSINSYLNFNNKASSLYDSEQYLDSADQENILKPLENKPQFKPLNRMLVAKYSDMEIQKELSEFFRIKPVRWPDTQS